MPTENKHLHNTVDEINKECRDLLQHDLNIIHRQMLSRFIGMAEGAQLMAERFNSEELYDKITDTLNDLRAELKRLNNKRIQKLKRGFNND